METVVGPPAQNGAELHLLTDWGGRDAARTREAGLLSFLVHVAFIVGLVLIPKGFLVPPERREVVVPLVAPLLEPTQTTPNRGKISKEVTAEALIPRPRIQIPPSPPSTSRAAAARPGTPGPPVPPAPAKLPEPPKMETAQMAQPPRVEAPTPPPQIQAQEKPRLALESPPQQTQAARPSIAVPSTSVQDAIRAVARGGTGGGLMVGDIGPSGPGGLGPGMNLPPSPGKAGSNLELLSDPLGVDFRPYLIRILSAVRRNWFAVMPESAKLGRRGRVGIQFAVDRDGSVPKLVIVTASGTEALDRAAVAGISASNPFPPLPPEFKGRQIRLQFNFMYNMQ